MKNIPALVLIMAWRRSGHKPLYEAMMVSLPMHICVTRPQWVKILLIHTDRCLNLDFFSAVQPTIFNRSCLYMAQLLTSSWAWNLLIMRCPWLFLPEALLAYGYCHCLRLCVCVCVCLSVCQLLLVRTITRRPFKLGSPNLNQKMQNILLKVPIVFGAD